MSQFDTSFDATTPEQQKTSGLAIASLVCSLICCVPITTILGILLGIGAMVSIGGDPAKKGKGLAVTGIVLGLIFTGIQGFYYPKIPDGVRYVKELWTLWMKGPNEALTMGFAGDTAGFKSSFFGDGATAPDEEVEAFIETLRARYGEFVSCRFDEQAGTTGGMGQPSMPVPYIIEFEGGTVSGEAEVVFTDPQRTQVVNKLGYVTIFDPDLGDLTYPGEVVVPEPADAPEIPEPADTGEGEPEPPTDETAGEPEPPAAPD